MCLPMKISQTNTTLVPHNTSKGTERKTHMTYNQKRILTLCVIIITAILLGRLAFRVFLNVLLGGTLFGGNFL